MMLSLLELRRAARLLKEILQGALLRRIKQTDDEQALILVFEAEKKFHVLFHAIPSSPGSAWPISLIRIALLSHSRNIFERILPAAL
jgi:hypothetical protein